MGTSPQSVNALENREKNGTITIAKLSEAAAALNCELKVVLVPRPALEETVRRQAIRKAREERDRLVHTMMLEAQAEGVESTLDESKAVERWLTKRIGSLWD